MSDELPSPWREFLSEVDGQLAEVVVLHCHGGFVAALHYGLPRATADLDYLEIVPSHAQGLIEKLGGQASLLTKKYGVYLQHFPLTSAPESYAERLTELFPGQFKYLRLLALDPYDLALSKLSRNTAVDREDVEYLARTVPLDPHVLRQRYQAELRPIMLGDLNVHDQTLEMWMAAYFPS
jgi:uncharacterized nucleotidyltransferase DUF6036